MLKKISNIGDCGITCDFGDEVNKNTNKEVIKLFNFIQDSVNRRKIKGILNYTPSYNKLIINFELGQIKSNQIIEFTREIKKYPIEFRLKIIETIWKIVYSDGKTDSYESTLIRRICGLLYVSDKDNGVIKERILKQQK